MHDAQLTQDTYIDKMTKTKGKITQNISTLLQTVAVHQELPIKCPVSGLRHSLVAMEILLLDAI